MRRLQLPRRPGHRPVRLVAFIVWLASLAAIVVSLGVWYARGLPEHPASFVSGPLGIAGITVAGVVYVTAGLWLVRQSPRNLLGWVVLGAGAGLAAVLVLNQYIEASIHPFRPVPELAVSLAWFSGALHLPMSAGAAVIALLLFPNGRLEWPPMKATAVLAAVGSGFLVAGTALHADGQLWYPTLPSPLDVSQDLGSLTHGLTLVGVALLVPAFVLAAVCMGWRYRRGAAEQRRPLAWVTLGGTVLAITLSALFVGRYSGLAGDVAGERLTFIAGIGAIVLPLTLIRFFRTSASAGVPVADVTFLFTDLADSSAMYRRFGDRPAFDLVRVHFETMRSVTRAHHGVVVKTIGDAIMAAFSQPVDAVATALEMFERIGELNERRDANLVLKVGVQRGPAILVGTRDHPDYFGQTVNAAARLQAAAKAGEICLSDEVLLGRGVADLTAAYEVSTEVTSLRGVADDITVHRVRVIAPAPPVADDAHSPASLAAAASLGSPPTAS